MNKLLATFLNTYTFQRQLGILVTPGIILLALLSSVVGSWLGNERVRDNLLEQGRNITRNLARQSALALIYASSDNATEVAKSTLEFPGVMSVEISDTKWRTLLKLGTVNPAEFRTQPGRGEADSQSTTSPFVEAAVAELLGYVTVVVSKTVLIQMTTRIFIAPLHLGINVLIFSEKLFDELGHPLGE